MVLNESCHFDQSAIDFLTMLNITVPMKHNRDITMKPKSKAFCDLVIEIENIWSMQENLPSDYILF